MATDTDQVLDLGARWAAAEVDADIAALDQRVKDARAAFDQAQAALQPDQQAIAQEPCEKAVISRQYGGTGFLIGADDCMHFFRIETRGERGRADKVAEHHRQLAALGY